MSPIMLAIGLVALLVVGVFVVRLIPKGGAHRRKQKAKQRKQESVNPQGAAPAAESQDWFSATFGGGLSQFPGLNVVFEAARQGDPNAIGMAQVFAQMVDNGGKLQLLQMANDLANKMFENGATAEQVLRAIEALVKSTQHSYQTPSRAPTFTVGPRRDRFSIKQERNRRNGR